MGVEDLKQIYKDKEAKIVAEERHIGNINAQKVVSDTIIESISSLIKYLEGKVTKTEVQNQIEDFATTEDALKIVSAIILLQKQVRDSQTDITPLLVGLNAVKEQIKSIPETKFEQKDSMKVTNLSEIKFDTKALEKAINDKNLEVNVEAPIIHTEKVDTKLVEKILSDIFKAVSKKPEVIKELKVSNLKDIKPTDTSKIEKELKQSNKHLKELVDKPTGGSGGGGRVSPYQDSNSIPAFVTLTAEGKVPVEITDELSGIATETTLASIKDTDGIKKITDPVTIAKPSGAGDNGAVTLTLANTAYAVPTVAPTSSYRMTVQNNSTAIIYIGYENSNANGLALQLLADAEIELGAGQQIYAYSATAGVALTYSLKES